jgi:hypothetical protein
MSNEMQYKCKLDNWIFPVGYWILSLIVSRAMPGQVDASFSLRSCSGSLSLPFSIIPSKDFS